MAALTERQSNSAGIVNDQQPNEMDGPHMNRSEEDENSLKGKIFNPCVNCW